MPRYVRYNPNRISAEERARRAKTYRVHGYKGWVDPYPGVHGTRPEKMVYEALVRRGIRFYFTNEFTYSIPEIDFIKEYQSDFRLPDQKIIIEVQGSYWHAKPEAVEADAFKFAVYEQTGWKPLAWWDFDIEADVNQLFLAEPALASYHVTANTGTTELAVVSRKIADSSKGIITMNKRRALRVLYRKKAVSIKKPKIRGAKSYAVGIR